MFKLSGLFKDFKLPQGGMRTVVIVICAAAIALIFIPDMLPKGVVKTDTGQTPEHYVRELEKSLSGIVGSINGVGRVKIMVTLEHGAETVYATDEKHNTDTVEDADGDRVKTQERDDSETKLIVVDGQNGKQPVVRTTVEPVVKGVIVVCDGGDDQVVKQRVTDAVKTALNISLTRVCVTKLSN